MFIIRSLFIKEREMRCIHSKDKRLNQKVEEEGHGVTFWWVWPYYREKGGKVAHEKVHHVLMGALAAHAPWFAWTHCGGEAVPFRDAVRSVMRGIDSATVLLGLYLANISQGTLPPSPASVLSCKMVIKSNTRLSHGWCGSVD